MGGIGECQTALETSETNVGGRFLYHTGVCQHSIGGQNLQGL